MISFLLLHTLVDEFLDHIAQDRPGAAIHVVDDIQAKVEGLADFPRMGPVFSDDSGPDIRRLILGKFILSDSGAQERDLHHRSPPFATASSDPGGASR